MIKKIQKDGYTIEYFDNKKYTENDIYNLIKDSLALIKHKELKDSKRLYFLETFSKGNESGRFYLSEKGFQNAENMALEQMLIKNRSGAHIFNSIQEVENFAKEHGIKEGRIVAKDIEDSFEPVLVHKDGTPVKVGEEVVDFRGNKAIVTGWQAPVYEGKSGRVYVKEIIEDKEFDAGYYPEVYGLSWKKEVEDIFVKDK